MHPQTISKSGIELVKKFEGLHRLQSDGMVSAYKCPAGRYTCGYGATKGVRSGTKWTQAYSEQRLLDDLEEHGDCFRHRSKLEMFQVCPTIVARERNVQLITRQTIGLFVLARTRGCVLVPRLE